jgi:hypothetical protein
MADRPRHPKPEVEKAIAYAEDRGWRWRKQGHWGRLYCPCGDREGCQIGVFGTPQNAGSHAKRIRRLVDNCPHGGRDEDL